MRAIAEWEKQELLFLSLPHYNTDWREYLVDALDSYKNLVDTITKFQNVAIISPNKEDFRLFFADNPKVSFYEIDTNDTWIRDYGVIDVMSGGRIIGYDFKFNAWGDKFDSSKDNAVNQELMKSFKGELKKVDLILEGGSIEFNGFGTMMTTTKCLLNDNRNRLSKNELEKKFRELFGVHTIIWLENGFIKGDDTDSHVDTLARFIGRNTIAYAACDDKNDIHYEPLKAMEDELKKTGFELVPLFIPKPIEYLDRRLPATYANFVFVNGALIVPTYGDEKYDQMALSSLRKALPDLEVVGVDARVLIRQNGSIHCATMNRFLGVR
ncbi:agmatine deiminase family protein [Campylobacter corcagiensis]|uniref:Agmatine deiminase family protein n=1 Tax=Campylobacter corcagiensis TaxID=1448857 RepID=A0A7M1LEH8_9BACT|nr:agmatine deiminase family protein [Campylobacter corcagiensis]QKF65123.1 agmatine deiminase [Campylobacter corcagiensis]QOQ86733.1 agmatine deiminase family protein [Campylobacter corcagiensis]